MKNHFASLLGIAFLELIGISASSAWAAAPGYCALYAREYARTVVAAPGGLSRLEDKAYYRCLNLDEEPELPSASIYHRADLDKATGPVVASLDTRVLLVPAESIATPPAVSKPAAKRKPAHHRRRHSTAATATQIPTTTNLAKAPDGQERRGFSVVRLLNRVGTLLQGPDAAVTVAEREPIAPTPPVAISPKSLGDKSCRNSPYMIARCSAD